jgi:hypothetical protein
MLIAASTIKDTEQHVRRFVRGNLGGGIDHLVVFLDQPRAPGQDEVADFLDQEPHVTCVRAGRGWWGEHRPAGLNERQCTNAGLVSHLLADAPEVQWVFHVDGDEVVRIDPDALAAVPAEVPAVRLAPREAVSKATWDGDPTLFKRLLGEADLQRLHQRGAIAAATNQAHFHGHLQGKVGVRPRRDLWLGLHKAIAADRTQAPTHADERLELFHYESYSGEEFARKWGAMTTSGPRVSLRAGRSAVADAVRDVLEGEASPDARHERLLALFEETTQDDAESLVELGLVLELDPTAGTHAPRPLSEGARTVLQRGLAEAHGTDRSAYFRGTSPRGGPGAGPAGEPGTERVGRRRSARSAVRRLLGRST